MIDPINLNLNQLPKKFSDGAVGSYGKDIFVFAITSGNNLDTYATNPQTMKSIAVLMNQQIDKYEKQFGVIDMTPIEIPSPFTSSDINK